MVTTLSGSGRPANLAAWCQRCHMLHDRPEHARRRWLTVFRRKACVAGMRTQAERQSGAHRQAGFTIGSVSCCYAPTMATGAGEMFVLSQMCFVLGATLADAAPNQPMRQAAFKGLGNCLIIGIYGFNHP